MAIAWVGDWTSAQFNNTTGGSLTGRTSTAGNFVGIQATATVNTATITHSQAGTVQTARAFENVGGASTDFSTLRYIENIVGGASHTITIATSAGQFSVLNATEYSGVATSSSIDQNNTGSGTGSGTLTTASVTTTQADELIICGGTEVESTSSAWTAGASFTLRGNIARADLGDTGFLEDRIVASISSYSGAATWSGVSNPRDWRCQIATFKAAGAAAAAGEASFPLTAGRYEDVLPGELRPYEVQVPELSGFWFNGITAVASADVNVTGLLVSGAALYGASTLDTSVVGLLVSGSELHAASTHDASVAGLLASGAALYGPTTHNAAVVGHLASGSALYSSSGTLAYIVTGFLTGGAVLYAPVSHDVPVAGYLASGAELHGVISHGATVAGLLASGAVFYAPAAHDATVVGYLVSGGVLYGLLSAGSDISVVGLLTGGAGLWAPISHAATVSGLLAAGGELHAPVSHTATAAGLLTSGAEIHSPVSHTTSVAGFLASGGVLIGDATHQVSLVGRLTGGAVLYALYSVSGPDTPDLHPILFIYREPGPLEHTETGLFYVEAVALWSDEAPPLTARDAWLINRENT